MQMRGMVFVGPKLFFGQSVALFRAASLNKATQNLGVSTTITIRGNARVADHLNHRRDFLRRFGLTADETMFGTSVWISLTRFNAILDGFRCKFDWHGTGDARVLDHIKWARRVIWIALVKRCD